MNGDTADSVFDDEAYRRHIAEVQATYDRLAPVFDDFYPPLDLETSPFVAALHEFLQQRGVKRILDCACGTGREVLPLAKTGQYDLIVATDLSSRMISVAKSKAPSAPVEWAQSDWLDLPERVSHRDFDALICLGNPFAHLPPHAYAPAFSAMAAMLRPGGLLLVNRRNWEAELGLGPYQRPPPASTLRWRTPSNSSEHPRISLLNVAPDDGAERMAYFTYHLYGPNRRTQFLHLLRASPSGEQSHEVFAFRCSAVLRDTLLTGATDAGFADPARIETLAQSDLDAYAEEEYLVARKL